MSDLENQIDATIPSEPGDGAGDAATMCGDPRLERRAARRRRVLWGLIVVLVGAAVGSSIGWSSQVPIYQSEGLIYIEPSMPSPQDPEGRHVLPMFEGFVQGQVQLLRSSRVAQMAMRTEPWKLTGEVAAPEALAHFRARLDIVHDAGTQHIRVQFRDVDPEVAVAGVKAGCEAYLQLAAEVNDGDDRLAFARQQVAILHEEIRARTQETLVRTSEYGGVEGLELRHRAAVEQLIALQKELEEIRQAIRAYKPPQPLTPGEISVESAQMAKSLLDLELLKAELEILTAKLQDNDEEVLALRMRQRAREKQIEQFADAWNSARAKKAGESTLDELTAQELRLVGRLEALRALSRLLGKTRADVERLKGEREELSHRLEQMERLRDQLENQLLGSGRIKVYSAGSLPKEPFRDDRTLYAWVGGALGGLGALFLFLLFGAVARRMGRVADANAYHAKVRAAIQLLPKRIGEWKAHDVGLPPGAARLPKPNVAMGREFQNPSTGENATLRIVQCRDARDLSAYYPPIQYPAEGWTLREAEPRHLPALLAAIPGTVYRFTKESSDGSSEVLVYNFFARPDGSIESGPAGALNAAAETHTQALGAAQFQILLGPSMTRDRRDEVFRTLIAAALPVMDALCVEDEA